MKSFAVVALAAILVPAALAQHQTFAVNPDTSEVQMTLNTTHEVVHGTFHIQSGGKTGNGSRDKKMSKDILEVGQHATVSFEPKTYTGAIAPSGDSTIQVTGIFTLLGTPHEITVPMLVHLEGTTATVKAHFAVPYIQWGLKDPSFMFWKADKDVAIDLFLNGRLSQ
jgi:polyisoprenoid-binding protein YceI